MSVVLISFKILILVCSSSALLEYKASCDPNNELHLTSLQDIYFLARCTENAPKFFYTYAECVLKRLTILKGNGQINVTYFEGENRGRKDLYNVIETVPKSEDNDRYILELFRIIFQASFHKVPSHCQTGYLNEEWNLCRKQNLVLPTKYVDIIDEASQLYSNPNQRFKRFITCGLKKDYYLTENGNLNVPVLKISKTLSSHLQDFQDIPIDADITEYGWNIFKKLVKLQD